jgi:hypothetical protein
MADKWAFLHPWREALAQCKAFHDTLDVEHSRAFKASHLPVHASIRCWPALPQGYELLAGRCSIPVPFPAATALRSDRERLQRVREAMELFNALAAVSRPAFLHLLAEFVVVADNFADLFTPDFIFVYPVWDCYLVGTLSSEDHATTGNPVTWGELFGCSQDPTHYSLEFRAAMDKLAVMRSELKGELCNFMGGDATAEWGDPGAAIEWTAEHVAIPTKGVQVATADALACPLELGAMFNKTVPPVVQLCAVAASGNLMKTWERLPPSQEAHRVETMKPRFAAPGGVELATALSRMSLTSLRLNLDELVDSVATGQASSNAGFLLSTLVCGRPLCSGEQCGVRQGAIADLQLTFAGNSAAGPAGACSAVLESAAIEALTVNMGTIGDQMWWLNQVRWGWLAYALWSRASKTSIRTARLTNIHLSRATVDAVAATLTNGYPPSTLEQKTADPAAYGYVDVQAGTKLRPCGLDTSDSNSLVMAQHCRCRALYEEDMGDRAEVVVPGYGVCTLQLQDGVSTYAPDYLNSQRHAKQPHSVKSLTLEFFEVEDPSLVLRLLSLIGGSLRSLKMGMFWAGRRRSIVLDGVAAACPQLEELCVTGFDVVLSFTEELRNWRLKKLAIQSCDEVVGLAECLSDSTYRMARELAELEVTLPRAALSRAGYADELTSHNGDYVAATKDKLPLESKAAMVSVVDARDSSTGPIHRLNETLMGFIFAFAATPMRRSVRVVSSSN